MDVFPVNDNLFSLMFMIQADLTEPQRERLTSHMSLRGVTLQQYNFEGVREAMIELLCAPRSSIENPTYRVSGQGRTFLVQDYGDCEGDKGYWVECEETGENGFLPEFEDVFWTFDEQSCFWQSRPFKGRSLKKGKGKGKGKGKKGKGKSFRPLARAKEKQKPTGAKKKDKKKEPTKVNIRTAKEKARKAKKVRSNQCSQRSQSQAAQRQRTLRRDKIKTKNKNGTIRTQNGGHQTHGKMHGQQSRGKQQAGTGLPL